MKEVKSIIITKLNISAQTEMKYSFLVSVICIINFYKCCRFKIAHNSQIDAGLLIKPNYNNIPQTLSLHQFQHQMYGISILLKMKYFKIDTYVHIQQTNQVLYLSLCFFIHLSHCYCIAFCAWYSLIFVIPLSQRCQQLSNK